MVGMNGANKPSETPDPIAENIPASSTLAAPADCAQRGRTEDAALGAESLVALMKSMDTSVVSSLVRARELAAGVSKSFPGGDERFASVDSDSDVDDGTGEESDDDTVEPCKGLFDETMDTGPEKCLRRAVEEHSFDLRAELKAASAPFLVRVRVANYLRKLVRDGIKVDEVIQRVREAINDSTGEVCTHERWLVPVLEGDLLLTALDDEESSDEEADAEAVAETVQKVLK